MFFDSGQQGLKFCALSHHFGQAVELAFARLAIDYRVEVRIENHVQDFAQLFFHRCTQLNHHIIRTKLNGKSKRFYFFRFTFRSLSRRERMTVSYMRCISRPYTACG